MQALAGAEIFSEYVLNGLNYLNVLNALNPFMHT